MQTADSRSEVKFSPLNLLHPDSWLMECEQRFVRAIVSGDNMYLLTEWEGQMGKYLAGGQDVRTECSEVGASWPRAKYFFKLLNGAAWAL